jgi:nitrate/TMAO reductase-like tetraheme cytochrome c subunit
MFNKFEQKLNDLSQGTVGYFCMRCHAPVATALCASRAAPLWTLPEAAREGITCIACHRVQYAYGKSNGERRIETGDIFAPVLGGIDGGGVAEAINRKEQLKIKTSPDDKGPGQNMHATGVYFQTLTKSEFCTPCHQVAVQPGIKLEVVWEQYRASPACKKGIQCQDCHMGKVPGLPLGYDCGPVAKIGDKTVNDNRKKSNHIFYGPNYPIAHPGVFPFHLKANRWTMEQWLTFDWRAGWGTKEFEKAVADGQIQAIFPPVWAETDDRCDAREIIDENIKKIEHKRDLRVQVMENGSHVDGPFFDSQLCRGQDLNFHYVVTNTNEGHNLLTASLGAQPQLWANVVLIGPDGQRLWETGYTDSSNDVCNIHSDDVRKHRAPYDYQLFNLQTMFLIQGATGTDREFYVPVNFDTDQLPFIRPGTQPITTINHPPGIRMESRSLAPLGSRDARFHVPGQLLKQPGTYRLAFRLRSRSEPIYFMRFCEATAEMERAENEWIIDVHPMTVEFVVR